MAAVEAEGVDGVEKGFGRLLHLLGEHHLCLCFQFLGSSCFLGGAIWTLISQKYRNLAQNLDLERSRIGGWRAMDVADYEEMRKSRRVRKVRARNA